LQDRLICKVITMSGHKQSMEAFQRLQDSAYTYKNDFRPELFEATIAENVEDQMKEYFLEWNYPWEGSITDLKTGLKKSAYPTQNRLNRMACAVSHYRLWSMCVDVGPMLIMEHDAIFIQRLRYDNLLEDKHYNIIGINNPIGNTRKSMEFHKILQDAKPFSSSNAIVPVPTIDTFDIPQGLAGNSAYIIKPAGAQACINAAKEYGLWPNDALMCKQLVTNMGVTKAYYTNTQQIVSTTTR